MSPREFHLGQRVLIDYVPGEVLSGVVSTLPGQRDRDGSPVRYDKIGVDLDENYEHIDRFAWIFAQSKVRLAEPAQVEPTDEQRAAVRWLQSWTAPNRSEPTQAHAQALLAALPDAFTNPQPARPTEPGHFEDDEGRHWLHQVYDGKGDHPDVDQWLNWGGQTAEPPTVLHRLVRERPRVTREQLDQAYDDTGDWYETATAILDLVNGDVR